MMFLGLFTLVVLPLFLIVSGRMLEQGHKDSSGRKIAAVILYIFAALAVIGGIGILVTI